MKIYTKTGDRGQTSLYGGSRVSKSDERVEAYGTIDELNAHVGFVVALLGDTQKNIIDQLQQIQNDLFSIGSHVATPSENNILSNSLPTIEESMVTRLEEQIDTMEKELPALTNFILPGGSRDAAQMHIARTVCRRAERMIVNIDALNPIIQQYLNRLSDWLFVCARLVNHRSNTQEILWKK